MKATTGWQGGGGTDEYGFSVFSSGYRKMVGKEQVIVETNRLYKEMAERHGVTWIDLYSKMVDPATGSMRKGLTNDGLHLLGAGYLVWRDAVLPYVKK